MNPESTHDTILIVDDELAIRAVLQQILENQAYRFLAAGDGLEAREILQSKSELVSAVILDWVMPRMTGIELLRWMKKQPSIEHIPVIVLTAMSNASRIKEGIDAGAFYYLTKPFQRDILRSIVQAAISDFHSARELRRKLKQCDQPLALLEEGTFRFRTIAEAELLAVRLANATPDPEHAVVISELLVNAMEHGNLGITYEEKGNLIDKNAWQAEVERRLALPSNAQKFVEVRFRKEQQTLRIEIEDQGPGFDYQRYLKFDESRVFDNHGRGIAVATASLNVEFIGPGNKVVVRIPLS